MFKEEVTLKMIISGVAPKQLCGLHEIIDSPVSKSEGEFTRIIEMGASATGCLRFLKIEEVLFNSGSASYEVSLEIRAKVLVCSKTEFGVPETVTVLAPSSVIGAVFEILGMFPESESEVVLSQQGCLR